MHAEGHGGVMMMLYAPISFLLLVTGFPLYALVGGVLICSMPSIPDIDMKLLFISHRGFTHSVWFGLMLGFANATLVLLAAASSYTPYMPNAYSHAAFAFFVGNMWVLGHLAGDAITKMGITPLTPINDWWIRIDIKLLNLPTTASSYLANKILLITGTVAILTFSGLGMYIRFAG